MKICILTHTYPRFEGDSAAPFMGELVKELSQNDTVYVLAPFDKEYTLKDSKNFKLKTYKYIWPTPLGKLGYSRTLDKDNTLSLLNLILSPLLIIFATISLIKLIKEEKIDIVSAHWIVPNGFIASIAKILTRVPYTVTIPGSDIYLGAKNKLFKSMVGMASNNAEVVLSDSKFYIEQLNNLGFVPKRTDVIPYGVNTDKFKPTKKSNDLLKKHKIIKSNKVILAVGRLVPKKGFIYLIKAMPDILKRNRDVKLVIVGNGGLMESLEREVIRLKIENNVIFAGTISHTELKDYYNIADIFVMPSIKDSMGNIDASPVALMEALACGAAIVGTKYSIPGGIFKEDDIGVLVKEKDSKSISNAILKLLNKKDMKRAAREKALNSLSTKVIAKRYKKIFESLI